MDANERVFYDKLFQVMRGFMEYGRYKGKHENAVKILVKAFPQRSKEELSSLFMDCCKAYSDAVTLVKENATFYSQSKMGDELPAENDYRKKHATVHEKMLTWIIGWIYHWYYER